MNAFDDVGDYMKPALVFFNSLGNGDEKYVTEAISHEVGASYVLQELTTSYMGMSYLLRFTFASDVQVILVCPSKLKPLKMFT